MISYSQYEYDPRVHRYAESLIERGDAVDVICLGAKGQPINDVLNGVHIYRIQTRDFNEKGPLSYLLRLMIFFLLSAFYCTALYLRKKYAVIHFHNIPDFGVFCTLIPKFMGAKIILDIHDPVPEFYARKFNMTEHHIIIKILKWIEKVSASYAHKVITVSDICKEILIKRSVFDQKCAVILNVPDPKLFKPRRSNFKSHSNTFRLIYHGNLSEFSGVDVAIRAMEIIRQNIPSVILEIFGQGRELDSLLRFTKDLGLEKEVHFNARVSRYKVPEILKYADVGIDTKRDGLFAGLGLSTKCMEFLAMGIPVVASRNKTAQRYYNDSMVMFFTPGNEQELAQRVIELYQKPQKMKQIVKNTKCFNKLHNWKRYRQVYYDILDSLIMN